MSMWAASKRSVVGLFAVAAAGAALAFWQRPELFRAREPRVIVVGLDAADWRLPDGYCADGTMPNLARFVREGRSGVRKVFQPPLIGTTITGLLAAADSGPAVERLEALGYVGSNEPAVRPEGAGTGTRTAGSLPNGGSLLLEDGKNAEPKAVFEQALRLDPKSSAGKYALAWIFEKKAARGSRCPAARGAGRRTRRGARAS